MLAFTVTYYFHYEIGLAEAVAWESAIPVAWGLWFTSVGVWGLGGFGSLFRVAKPLNLDVLLGSKWPERPIEFGLGTPNVHIS